MFKKRIPRYQKGDTVIILYRDCRGVCSYEIKILRSIVSFLGVKYKFRFKDGQVIYTIQQKRIIGYATHENKRLYNIF